MRRTALTLSVAMLAIAAMLPSPASAQAQATKKTARGTVTAMTATGITVNVAGSTMNFTVDDKTTVEAPGAGTASRRAAAEGKPGPKLADVVKTGQNVEVQYTETGGTMHASSIRRISAVGSPESAVTTAPSRANGKVTAITPGQFTIAGSGANATPMTFVIDAKTKIIGPGAGTAARAAGGAAPAPAMISTGDTVSVEYTKVGDAMHASEIRVTQKAPK